MIDLEPLTPYQESYPEELDLYACFFGFMDLSRVVASEMNDNCIYGI